MKETHGAAECVKEWNGESPWDGRRWQNRIKKTLRLSRIVTWRKREKTKHDWKMRAMHLLLYSM